MLDEVLVKKMGAPGIVAATLFSENRAARSRELFLSNRLRQRRASGTRRSSRRRGNGDPMTKRSGCALRKLRDPVVALSGNSGFHDPDPTLRKPLPDASESSSDGTERPQKKRRVTFVGGTRSCPICLRGEDSSWWIIAFLHWRNFMSRIFRRILLQIRNTV